MNFLRTALLTAFWGTVFVLSAQNGIKSPDEFLPYRLGEQFTPHHLLTAYFEYLAANAPKNMQLQQYGTTNEDRPLKIAIFSAPENMARLEQIRLNNLRLAEIEPGNPDLSKPIAIVWLGMSVHGNEPAGSECSLELAYRLAAQTDPQLREWLKNTVVIIDPSMNPDGYDRYTHWYRMVANKTKNIDFNAREHREPWPGGRTNHYYFDLNRDWAWATQLETRQRLAMYHSWLPQIHADLHEQYVENPYYFAPAAEPMHDYITKWQRQFQTEIGQNHASYFDKNGWLYFTREVFDLFYPSYGDTYPMFNGAIGMTYEQGGHAMAGRAITLRNGDTLTLHDRIEHHLVTSLSTIEMGSKNARRIVENYREYFHKSATKPEGDYVSFVISGKNDPNKVNALCSWLNRHHVRYGRAGASGNYSNAFDYCTGKDVGFDLHPNDLVISAYQPHGVFVQVLFEPSSHLVDSLTYDITAWAIPYAYGLEAYALKTRIEPKSEFVPFRAPEVMPGTRPYAWCIDRNSFAEAQFLSKVLGKGLNVRCATRAFDLADQHFEPGALVIARADNMRKDAELDNWVRAAALATNVTLHPIFTGFSSYGNDLGSDAFTLMERPRIALVYGDDVDDNAFGHAWFFFEEELGYPVTPISTDQLPRLLLSGFTTIILPDGNYNFSDPVLKKLKEWMRDGGKLIALENAVRAFADKDGFDLKSKSGSRPDTMGLEQVPYLEKERDQISDQLPGAIVKAKVDPTYPIGFGLGEYYFSLKTSSSTFEMPQNAVNVVWLEKGFNHTGFIGSRLEPKLDNTPIVAVQKMGRGSLLYFIDNPLYRAFWHQGKFLFANGLFN